MFARLSSFSDLCLLLLRSGLLLTCFHAGLVPLCLHLPQKWIAPTRSRYAIRPWEQKFYRRKLHIHAWKDHVPQYVPRNGFSKAQLELPHSPAYLDRFLLETCRGEWYHTMGLWSIPLLFFLNPPLLALPPALVLLLLHGACIAIQRYNRIRLEKVRRRME